MINYLIIFILVCSALPLFGDAYTLDISLGINDLNKEKVYSRYPKIERQSDVTGILKYISKNYELDELIVRKLGNNYIFSGVRSKYVERIEVNAFSASLQSALRTSMVELTGRIHSKQTYGKISYKIKDVLLKRGFARSSAKVVSKPSSGGIVYIVSIDEKPPCLIKNITINFEIPNNHTFPIKSGEICDTYLIAKHLRGLQEDLNQDQYYDSIVRLGGLKFDPQTNTADITIEGRVGKNRIVVVETETDKFQLDDYWKDSEVASLTSVDLEPETFAVELLETYKTSGHLNAKVIQRKIVQKSKFKEEVYFKIKKGSRFKVTELNLKGNTVFDSDRLARLLGIDGVKPEDQFINQESIENGISALKNRYQENGYLDIQISQPIYKKISDDQVELHIDIEENQQHILKETEFKGLASLKEKVILKELDINKKTSINIEKAAKWEEVLVQRYNALGFLFVKVFVKFESISGSTEKLLNKKVVFDVREGPRVRIGQVFIKGLIKTKRLVVERELLFKTGDWYLQSIIERTQKNLTSIGTFANVNIRIVKSDILDTKSDIVDIVVDVRESLPGTVVFGPGFSLDDGFRFRFDTSYVNLQGLGRKVFSQLKVTEERKQLPISHESLLGRLATIGYVEPWVLGLPIDATFLLKHSAEAEEHWTISHSGEISLDHRVRYLLQDATIGLFYELKNVEERQKKGALLRLISTGNIQVGKVGVRFQLDERNDRRWPTSGFFANGKAAWARYALGGELRYFNWSFGARFYYELLQNIVFATAFSYETFEGIELSEPSQPQILPSAERLYAGGGETVRGFIERSLGADIESDDEVGGSNRILWKNELRYLIYDPVVVTLFGDFGNVWFSKAGAEEYQKALATSTVSENKPNGETLANNVDYSLVDFLSNPLDVTNHLYFSYGMSLGALTPLGSLNVAFGIPHSEPRAENCKTTNCITKADHSQGIFDRGRFSFNFGVTF